MVNTCVRRIVWWPPACSAALKKPAHLHEVECLRSRAPVPPHCLLFSYHRFDAFVQKPASRTPFLTNRALRTLQGHMIWGDLCDTFPESQSLCSFFPPKNKEEVDVESFNSQNFFKTLQGSRSWTLAVNPVPGPPAQGNLSIYAGSSSCFPWLLSNFKLRC